MRHSLLLPGVLTALILSACVSAGPAAVVEGSPDSSVRPGSPDATLNEMRRLMDAGKSALDSNHPTEGIRSFVAVMALAREDGSREASALGAEAEAELVRIGTRLSLEPGEAWVGADGSQIAGSCRSVGREGALQPTVFLFENWGSGKSPVSDATIRFEFVRGGGVLTANAATDAYGRANAIVSRLDSPQAEAVIRAYPVFTVRGFTYAFSAVQRDFTYLPSTNITKVVAMERSPDGASSNPAILDIVAVHLKQAGLETSPLNGKLIGSEFDKAFGGNPASIRTLASASGASYFAFVLSEASAPRQMEYGGKKYNIFTSDCAATLRILRDDGTIVFTLPLDTVRGQGGTAQAAIADALGKAAEALDAELRTRIPEVQAAIAEGR